jgi:hypothetical protein
MKKNISITTKRTTCRPIARPLRGSVRKKQLFESMTAMIRRVLSLARR